MSTWHPRSLRINDYPSLYRSTSLSALLHQNGPLHMLHRVLLYVYFYKITVNAEISGVQYQPYLSALLVLCALQLGDVRDLCSVPVLLPKVMSRLWRLLGILAALTPVLATLTSDVAEDSIYAMAIVLFLLAIAAAPFVPLFSDTSAHLPRRDARLIEHALSMNAAIFAAVILCSRLQAPLLTYLNLVIAITCFDMWPPLRTDKVTSTQEHVVILTALLLSATIDVRLAAFHALVYAITSVFLPFLFSFLRQYKCRLNGSWDLANQDIYSTAADQPA